MKTTEALSGKKESICGLHVGETLSISKKDAG